MQLVSDFTFDHTSSAFKFYLNMTPISQQHYCELVSHPKVAYWTAKTFISVMSTFYSHKRKGIELEDSFGGDIQNLSF